MPSIVTASAGVTAAGVSQVKADGCRRAHSAQPSTHRGKAMTTVPLAAGLDLGGILGGLLGAGTGSGSRQQGSVLDYIMGNLGGILGGRN